MQLNDFSCIDEVVEVGKEEFKKRSTAQSIKWIPSKQNIYVSQCKKYTEMFEKICCLSDQELICSGLNPSQFIKGAQDYQLAAKYFGSNKSIILENFMRLANIGMMLKRHYYEMYRDIINNDELCYLTDNDMHVCMLLHAALRSYSEALYLDDHTISGEFYSLNNGDDGQIIVRVYKRLSPKELLHINSAFNITEIETFCIYKGTGIEIDTLGNLQYAYGSCPSIEKFACRFKNDKGIYKNVQTFNELQALLMQIESQIMSVMDSYYRLDYTGKARRLVEIAYYAFQPVIDDWIPNESDLCLYLDSIEKEVLFDAVSERYHENKPEDNSGIMKIIDPRCEL